jgi:hypothetical protein
MTFLGGFILGAVCLFLTYVLVRFHLETKRPRRIAAVRSTRNVVPFRTLADVRGHVAPHAVELGERGDMVPLSAGAGFRRLAVKRAGRS